VNTKKKNLGRRSKRWTFGERHQGGALFFNHSRRVNRPIVLNPNGPLCQWLVIWAPKVVNFGWMAESLFFGGYPPPPPPNHFVHPSSGPVAGVTHSIHSSSKEVRGITLNTGMVSMAKKKKVEIEISEGQKIFETEKRNFDRSKNFSQSIDRTNRKNFFV
jgi:hypothetical protein